MRRLYFVFEQTASDVWYLKAIYDAVNFDVFCEELKNRAEYMVMRRLNDDVAKYKARIPVRPNCPKNLETILRQMKKQSNAYRLEGKFDEFIAINAQIREMKQLLREQVVYEDARRRYQLAKRRAQDMGEEYKRAVEGEYNKIARSIMVFSSNVEMITENEMRLTVYANDGWPNNVDYVDYAGGLNICMYHPFIKFQERKQHIMAEIENSLRRARERYAASKLMLDNCKDPVESPEYKKIFQMAVKAYYRVEEEQREACLRANRLAAEEHKINEAFNAHCFSCKATINEYSASEKGIANIHFNYCGMRKFGTHVSLPNY